MNQYAVKHEDGSLTGPFKTAQTAAKWANATLRKAWNRTSNWSIVRLFKP